MAMECAASASSAPLVPARPIRRLCWSCGGLFECEVPRDSDAAGCSARCPHCSAVTSALVPPACGAPFPGAYERPASVEVALRRVRALLKRRRPSSSAGVRFLVEWEEDPTADYALVHGRSASLQPLSWEPELHVSTDPSLVATFDETRRPDKDSVAPAFARPRVYPAAAGGGAAIELTVGAHLFAASDELPVTRPPPPAIWLPGDQVEVQWKGKGFRGSWALASVVQAEKGERLRVRFARFVDEDGEFLEEWLPRSRLRLAPPAVCSRWRPVPGERVEALSNDLWWEGTVERYDSIKGYLFVYDCHRSWLWLPLGGLRPRPASAILSYHRGRSRQGSAHDDDDDDDDEGGGGGADDDDDDEGAPPASRARARDMCPHAGCKLLERHSGLCQFGDDSLAGRAHERSTRPKGSLMERTNRVDLLLQEEILEMIRRERSAQHASLRARQARMPSKVIPGSRMAQWHPHLFAHDFSDELCALPVFECEHAPGACRGQLVVLASHIVADVLRMLGSELGIDIDGKRVLCMPHTHPRGAPPDGLVDLAVRPRGEPVVHSFPADTRIDLLVV